MKKIKREDWFKAGLRILASEGPTRLTIEALCGRLKMTKGSFYHHFRNMDGYIVALMQHWLEENTLAFIRRAETKSLLGGALKARLAASLNNKAERAVRAWSHTSPLVAMYLRQLDNIRLKYLENTMKESGLDAKEALCAARLDYALMVGMQQLYPELAQKDLRAMYDSLRA